MYANGEGALQDLSKAKYWIKKAYEAAFLYQYTACLASFDTPLPLVYITPRLYCAPVFSCAAAF
jgi:hypothetical protein